MDNWDSYRDDLDALKTESDNLIQIRNDVMKKIAEEGEEEQQPMKPTNEVQRLWLPRVQAVETEVDELIRGASEELEKLHLGGMNISMSSSSYYKLEDMVADKLEAVRNLIKEGAFLVADEVPVVTTLIDEGAPEVAVAETIPAEDVADDQWPIVGMESIINEVWRCLKKEGEDDDDEYEDVGIIGVYGMGGVGKTTLLKQINKKLDLEMKSDFDVVIWVVVSRDLQLDKIQQQIGEKIGLFDNKVWKHKNFEEKASDIFKILEEKKFVLLMDDLWGRVDLTIVGVPLPSPENSSKIVFTTRSLQICSLMEADKQFKVTCLSDYDAWELFQALVGDETLQSHPEVTEIAEGVCRSCCGLPLALVSIGRAMTSKKKPQEWRDVLEVLRRSTTSYSGSDDQLKKDIRYNLKLSYDNLQNDMFKSCFLYCCLFPRNQGINKRDLIDYWIGEGFLDDRLGAQLSRGHYIIDVLLSVCLLEQSGKDDSYVKMHYWIHDMSLWIASKIEMEKGNCFFCTDTDNLTEAQAPLTEILVKATRMSLRNEVVIENLSDAPKCPHLQTLFLIDNSMSEVISNDFFLFMPCLKVLNLSSNYRLTKLPWGISNLISLQHLDLSCTGIEELPKELRALKKLKCLNLEKTDSLCTIPRQLISEFSMLHVLRLWKCGFMLQSNEDSVVCNDAQLLIEELLCLKNLSMLSISLKNSHALQRLLSSNRLQSCTQSLCLRDLSHPKSIKVPLTDLKHLSTLVISNCEYLEELEVDFVGEAQAQDVRESPCTFYFLHKVIIRGCRRLRELTWLILAPNLKHLEISDCDEMEEIINVGKLSDCPELMGNVIPFSKLKFLTLSDLPKLRSIYWTDLPFPDLKKLSIDDCPMLLKVPLTGLKHLDKLEISNCEYLEELEVDFVGEAQAQDVRESPCSFYVLHEVIIRGCRRLRELTRLILAPNLKHLEISDCKEMEEIINVGKLSECRELMGNVIPFSKLKCLTLLYLPKLRSIYWTDLPFPDLKELNITACPMLHKVPLTGLKHLSTLVISNCEYLEELEVDFVGEAQAQDIRESPCSFYFLHKVIIRGRRRLRELTWLILAPNLKHLEISDCDEMEEIINVGKLSDCPELMGNVIPFSKLKFLTLSDLPKLRSIYWTDLPFPDLKKLSIDDCPMLLKVPLTGLKHLNKLKISNCEYLEELEVDFVGEAQAQDVRESPCSFYFLHKVIIRECRRLRELTWLILAPNLKHLEILDCDEMEEIINVGKLSECPEFMGNVIPFSKLEFLSLKYLRTLRSIYWTDLPFPDLKEPSRIRKCPMLPVQPRLLKFTSGSDVEAFASWSQMPSTTRLLSPPRMPTMGKLDIEGRNEVDIADADEYLLDYPFKHEASTDKEGKKDKPKGELPTWEDFLS